MTTVKPLVDNMNLAEKGKMQDFVVFDTCTCHAKACKGVPESSEWEETASLAKEPNSWRPSLRAFAFKLDQSSSASETFRCDTQVHGDHSTLYCDRFTRND